MDICIQKKRKKEKLYLNPDLVPSIKIYSRYRPKCKVKIIKLLEEKIYETLFGLHFGKDFLNMSPKVKFMKEKIETLDFTKIKKFSLKDTIKRIKSKPQRKYL